MSLIFINRGNLYLAKYSFVKILPEDILDTAHSNEFEEEVAKFFI